MLCTIPTMLAVQTTSPLHSCEAKELLFSHYVVDFRETLKRTNPKFGPKRLEMPLAPSRVGDHVLLNGSYLVEFAAGSDATNHFQHVVESLQATHDIHPSKIEKRRVIDSELFSGVSFSVYVEHPIEAIEMIESAIAIYPIYSIHTLHSQSGSAAARKLDNQFTGSINSHDLTGISQVHQQLQNFGKGVRVSNSEVETVLMVVTA